MQVRTRELFEVATRAARVGVWEWDLTSNEVVWSAEVSEIFGSAAGDFDGTYAGYLALIAEEDRQRVVHAIEEAIASGAPFTVVHRVGPRGERAAWVAGHGSVLRDATGKATRMLGVVRDVTDEQIAEHRLRENEARFRELAEASLEAIVFSADGRVVDVNPAAVRMLGFDSPEELVGHAVVEFVHPDDLQLVAAHRDAASEASYVHRAVGKGGRVVHVEACGRPITYRGRPVRLTALRDVTARVEAETRLQERDEFLRSIVETSQDWIWAIDPEGHHVYSNPAIEAILGYSVDTIQGGKALDLMHPEDVERGRALMAESIAKQTGWNRVVLRWRHANGTLRTLESSSVATFDDQGRFTGFRGVDRDITERLDMQADKARLEEQLRHAQKMEAIGQLAGGIAHDFNNLLSVISGNIQMIADALVVDAPPAGDIAEEVAEIQGATRRAVELTGQLLAFGRRQVSNPTALDLNDTLRRMSGMLRRLVTENIQLRIVAAPNLPRVFADEGHLEQVILNLVVNARDAMPDGGILTLSTTTRSLTDEEAAAYPEALPGRFVGLMVADTGIGMDAKTRARIFEPFFTTKGLGRGTGLGLSMAYGIVRQADGFISVYSEPGLGSTFAIYLPATTVVTPAQPRRGLDQERLRGTETLLVCEDDPAVRRLAVRMLSRAGYAVLEAGDGDQALTVEAAHTGPIDLLLTDVIMPNVNGRELSATLTRRRPGLKTVFFSGYDADIISHHGVLHENVAFVQKPFERAELLARVRQVLDQGSR